MNVSLTRMKDRLYNEKMYMSVLKMKESVSTGDLCE
jgi:hypothetical protein